MKKLLSLLLSILLLFTFVGCDSTNSSTSTNNSSQIHTCSFGEWKTTWEATCTQPGTETRTCQTCSNTETRTIPSLSHLESNGTCLYCKKVMNAYRALAHHIKTNGTYSDDTNEYLLVTDSFTYEGKQVTFGSFYDAENNELDICLMIDDSTIFIDIIENSTVYEYSLFYGDTYMTGNLNPLTFSKETTSLTYTYTNISSSYPSLRTSFMKMAVSYAKLLIELFNLEFKNIQITAKDLGFINF